MSQDTENRVRNTLARMRWGQGLVVIVGIAVIVFVVAWLVMTTSSSPSKLQPRSPAHRICWPTGAGQYNEYGFVPATISVKVGQPIVWTNKGTMPHIVASDPYPTDDALPSFDAKQNIIPGASYRYVFTKSGTYTYHDNLHPTLLGTVFVKG